MMIDVTYYFQMLKLRQVRTAFFVGLITLPLFCWSGTPASHHPQTFLEKIQGLPDEGEQIRDHFCTNCHGEKPLISLGAPRVKDAAHWDPRVKAGIDAILKHTQEGFNAMPPRGGCFECTDEQLMRAIIAMLPEEAKASFVKALSLKDIKNP